MFFGDKTPIPETSGKVHKITSLAELDAILKSHSHVIIDFMADWCPPCRAIAPVYSKLADEFAGQGKLAFCKVNVDHAKDVAKRYGVTAMPTFLPIVNGKSGSVRVDGVKAGRSVVQGAEGSVERILGADVVALKALVKALNEQAA